jgi:Methyltransferase FkbM domain
VGDRTGRAELWFPESEEWLGTTSTAVKDSFKSATITSRLEVRQVTLDSYIENYELKPHLIKIDTEGNELSVLRGCSKTLSSSRPLVIFEVWPGTRRGELSQFFAGQQYGICNLPIVESFAPATLSTEQFDSGGATNFIAIPQESLETWPPKFDQS